MNYIKFENKDFESFVTKEFEKSDKEIFSVNYENKKYWIKKGRETSSNIFHKLFYKILPFEVLLPVQSKTAKEAILFESNKIIKFESLGINVPIVMGSNERFFVLSDCGTHIYDLMRTTTDKEYFYEILELYILELSKIHNSNEYHGGAQSRNFTFFENKIFVIDLEDSFEESVNLKTLQFRDLLLLLLSMAKIENIEFEYSFIINKYIENSSNKEFTQRLRKLTKNMRIITSLGRIGFIYNLSRDTKGFFKLLNELSKL